MKDYIHTVLLSPVYPSSRQNYPTMHFIYRIYFIIIMAITWHLTTFENVSNAQMTQFWSIYDVTDAKVYYFLAHNIV